MATVTVRLKDTTKFALEERAVTQGVSLSDLIRDSLEDLVQPRLDEERDSVAPGTLSPVDRQQLVLLHRIAAAVDPDGEDGGRQHHLQRAAVLEGGFVLGYEDEFADVRPELPVADSKFVMDVLDLFQQAAWAMTRLEQGGAEIDSGLRYALTFQGFDLSDAHESRLLAYAEHLVSPSRWAVLQDRFTPEHDYGNSHSRMVDVYARMVAERKTIIAGRPIEGIERYRLGMEDLKRIADSRRQRR